MLLVHHRTARRCEVTASRDVVAPGGGVTRVMHPLPVDVHGISLKTTPTF